MSGQPLGKMRVVFAGKELKISDDLLSAHAITVGTLLLSFQSEQRMLNSSAASIRAREWCDMISCGDSC